MKPVKNTRACKLVRAIHDGADIRFPHLRLRSNTRAVEYIYDYAKGDIAYVIDEYLGLDDWRLETMDGRVYAHAAKDNWEEINESCL